MKFLLISLLNFIREIIIVTHMIYFGQGQGPTISLSDHQILSFQTSLETKVFCFSWSKEGMGRGPTWEVLESK